MNSFVNLGINCFDLIWKLQDTSSIYLPNYLLSYVTTIRHHRMDWANYDIGLDYCRPKRGFISKRKLDS